MQEIPLARNRGLSNRRHVDLGRTSREAWANPNFIEKLELGTIAIANSFQSLVIALQWYLEGHMMPRGSAQKSTIIVAC
jgi:hypothetical protein